MRKLCGRMGETLPETLVALLLIVLTFLFLSGAVASAARANNAIKNEAVAFQGAMESGGFTVQRKEVEMTFEKGSETSPFLSILPLSKSAELNTPIADTAAGSAHPYKQDLGNGRYYYYYDYD